MNCNHTQSSTRKMIWRAAAVAAKSAVAAACVVWVGWWILVPDKIPDNWVHRLHHSGHSRFFGTEDKDGSAFFFQTLPWLAAAIVSVVYIELRACSRRSNDVQQQKQGKGEASQCVELADKNVMIGEAEDDDDGKCRSRINGEIIIGGGRKDMPRRGWRERMTGLNTCPVLVGGSILTAAEVAGFLSLALLLAYCFFRLAISAASTASDWQEKLGRIALVVGHVSNIPFSLLWIPVARGSPLLHLLGIPFERAVCYHIWLATCTIGIISLHSLLFILYFAVDPSQNLMTIFRWDHGRQQCAILAGVVAWAVALIILISSLPFFRRRFYDKFYLLHHLYLPFTLFWLYHVVWTHHFFIIPVLLFFLDRFLRMLQSSHHVNVLSAKLHPCGALELTLPLSPSFNHLDNIDGTRSSYNALSTWCINIPSISKYEWHFFSGTSSPLDKTNTVSIIIKPLGDWTNKFLRHRYFEYGHMSTKAFVNCPFSLKAKVEGPYGDESNFYLKYKSLVLVAGGIGVTPVLAILRDILHRHQNGDTRHTITHSPTSIVVYHCIRKPTELCILNSVDPHQILPNYDALGLDIQVRVYITSKDVGDYNDLSDQSGGCLDINANHCQALNLSNFRTSNHRSAALALQCPSKDGRYNNTISSMRTFGSTDWLTCTTAIASILGYFVLLGLANVYIIKSNSHDFYNYNQAHLIVACMMLGIVAFGGSAILGWVLARKHRNKVVQARAKGSPGYGEFVLDDEENVAGRGAAASPWEGEVHLFHRPNWRDAFDGLSERYAGKSVGVLVSGPGKLQEDVARECKRSSSLSSNTSTTFHYHSLSFEF